MKGMKRIVLSLNVLLLVALLASTIAYMCLSGLRLKALTAGFFTLPGLINMLYALSHKEKRKGFPIAMGAGLAVCMLADVVLNIDFVIGAVIFMAGHALYVAAFCLRSRWVRQDTFATLGMLLVSALLLTFLNLDFDMPFLYPACAAYGAVISFMVGKAVSTALRERTPASIIMGISSVMFYFSDLMLLLYFYGGASRLADRLCLITYFPAQGLFALSIFIHTWKEALHERTNHC